MTDPKTLDALTLVPVRHDTLVSAEVFNSLLRDARALAGCVAALEECRSELENYRRNIYGDEPRGVAEAIEVADAALAAAKGGAK